MLKLIKRERLAAFLAVSTLLTGCSGHIPVSECSWVKIITVSRQDVLTDETARQLLAHNEKVEAICGR